MKLSPLLLAGSLAANAIFAFALWRSHALPSAGSATVSSDSAADRAASPADRQHAQETKARAALPPGSWTAVSSGDLKDMVERLRTAGWPASIIRAIVAAEVHARLAARYYQGLADNPEDDAYWSSAWNSGPSPKLAAAQRSLAQEQARILAELLGDDSADRDEFARYWRRRQYGDLAPEKIAQAQRIGSDYNDLRNEIFRSASGGPLTPEDQAKLSYLDQQMQADLAKVLTPAELEDYQLRTSMTANTLRNQLAAFEPTADEFRAIYRATQAANERLGLSSSFGTWEQLQQRNAAVAEAAKTFLSPERQAEFAQATDPRYGALNHLARRYELPRTVVPQVAALQESYQSRAGSIRGDAKLSADQRATQLSALADEAGAKLGALLGASAFDAYKQVSGFNFWFKPPPAPPGTAAPKG